MQYTFFQLLAQVYDCGAYGAGNYNQGACTTQEAASGPLSYTGEPWVWMLVVAVIIIAVSVGLLIRNKRKK